MKTVNNNNTLSTFTKGLIKGLEDLEIKVRMETIQTTALLRSARVRIILETWGDLLSLRSSERPDGENSQGIIMDDQRKDHIDTKGPKKRNCPKQLPIHNLPTDDVENINSTNKGRDLLLANKPWFVPWRTERMLQRIQRHNSATLHRSTHPKWEQDQTEKSSYGLNWQQKGIWYGSA